MPLDLPPKICRCIARDVKNLRCLWHNFNFVCGNRPFVQPSWSSLGVNTCGDIYDDQGLCSFQTLRAKFCLPASAYFVFLQLRSALKAYGVPWSSSISSHPMRDWIAPSACRPSVYTKIIDCITKPLSIKTIWNRELSDLNLSVDWERVWSNLLLTSKNLAHHLIHFKVIHRAYITPYKRFKMKLQSNLNCHIVQRRELVGPGLRPLMLGSVFFLIYVIV